LCCVNDSVTRHTDDFSITYPAIWQHKTVLYFHMQIRLLKSRSNTRVLKLDLPIDLSFAVTVLLINPSTTELDTPALTSSSNKSPA